MSSLQNENNPTKNGYKRRRLFTHQQRRRGETNTRATYIGHVKQQEYDVKPDSEIVGEVTDVRRGAKH